MLHPPISHNHQQYFQIKSLKTCIYCVLCLGYLLIYPSFVTSQELQNLVERPKNGDSMLEFGVDKIANTFVFTGNAAVEVTALGGLLSFSNVYRSSAFRTATMAVRDDELSVLSYEKPITTGFTAVARSSWVLSRDNRAIGLSSLQRLNGVGGIRYNANDVMHAELFAGLESTTQLGVEATGPIVGLTSSIQNINLEPLILQTSLLTDWHKIDNQRTNADAQARIIAEHYQPDGSYLRLSLGGLGLQREYLTIMSGGTLPDAVESRTEQRYDGGLDVRYVVTPQVTANLSTLVNVNGIGRAYGNVLSTVPVTAIQRFLEEFVLDVQGSVAYQGAHTSAMVATKVFKRTEDNTVREHFPLDATSAAQLTQQEFLRDNRTSRFRFLVNGAWQPSANDSLSVDYTWWLLQYDTPSDANNDDRDELSAIAALRYARRINDVLTVGVTLGGQFLHTVYLKAARSAFNNENSVLRLSPFVRLTAPHFSMHPRLEVLANYTVYDFEGKGAQARSYGYRQVSYRDSIRIVLSSSLRLEIPALIRYFERSTLLWNDFSEIPQVGNLEYLINTRIFAQPAMPWDVGVGIRWYTFEQRSLMATPGLSPIIGSIRSWAPEVVLRFRPVSGSTLDLGGWYEFQTLTPHATRELPNLLLHAQIAL